MVQYYSDGLAVAAGGFFPLNNAAYAKGCTASHGAPATIELNKKGVYNVSVDSFATLEAAGDYSIQLYRNGVPMAQAINTTTVAAGDIGSTHFSTFVVVPNDNCACNCVSAPVTLQIANASVVDVTDAHVNVTVTKIC